MDHFAGLDVSVKETSICIVDDAGKIVREVKVASEPEALLAALKNPAYHFKRIGLEAGPLSQWLFSALAEAGLRGQLIVLDREVARAGAPKPDHAAPVVVQRNIGGRKGGEHHDRFPAILGFGPFDDGPAEYPFSVANAAVEAPAAVDPIALAFAHGAARREKEIEAVGIVPFLNTCATPVGGRNVPSDAIAVAPTMVHQPLVKS